MPTLSLSRALSLATLLILFAVPSLQAADAATQRLELDSYLASLETSTSRVLESDFARAVAAKSGLAPLRQLREARIGIARLSDADVAATLHALRSDEAVAGMPSTMDRLFTPSVRQRLRTATNAVPASCDPGPGTPLGITDLYIAKGVALAANLVMEGFPTDGITILARLIPIAAWGAAETASLVLEGLNAVEAECLGAQFEASVENFQSSTTSILNDSSRWTSDADLNSAVSTITGNDNNNRSTIVSNDNNNTSTITTNDNNNRNAITTNDNNNRVTITTNDNANRDIILAAISAGTTTVVNNDNANRDALINELRSLGCDIIRLLNTPEGQRSSAIASCTGRANFPYDFPEKKISGVGAAPAVFEFASSAAAGYLPRRADTTGIESALLEKRMVPSYYLPSARGGHAEDVKQHVWRTIEAQVELKIAPAETDLARQHAARADALLDGGSYVEAYRMYSQAFRALLPSE